MRRNIYRLGALFGLFALSLVLTLPANAQDKEKQQRPRDRLEGLVHEVDKDKSTITLSTEQGGRRYVIYNANTRFTMRNEPASLDEVKEGRRLICVGKFDSEGRLTARRIEVRTEN